MKTKLKLREWLTSWLVSTFKDEWMSVVAYIATIVIFIITPWGFSINAVDQKKCMEAAFLLNISVMLGFLVWLALECEEKKFKLLPLCAISISFLLLMFYDSIVATVGMLMTFNYPRVAAVGTFPTIIESVTICVIQLLFWISRLINRKGN